MRRDRVEYGTMKTVRALAVLLLTLPLCCAQTAPPKQDVQTLLDKIAASYGGWERVRSIRAMRLQRSVQRTDKAYQFDMLLLPDRVRRDDNELGYTRSVIASPALGVFFSAGKTDTAMTPAQKESWATNSRFSLTFLLQQAANPAYSFRVDEGETIAGSPTTILEVSAYGTRERLYVEGRTGRVIRRTVLRSDGTHTTSDFSDWVMAGGIAHARKQHQKSFGAKDELVLESDITTTGIEFNPTVDERLFERNGPALADIPFHPAAFQAAPSGPKPLTFQEVQDALRKGLPTKRMTEIVREYGVDFAMTPEREKSLRAAGADDSVLYAISQSKR